MLIPEKDLKLISPSLAKNSPNSDILFSLYTSVGIYVNISRQEVGNLHPVYDSGDGIENMGPCPKELLLDFS